MLEVTDAAASVFRSILVRDDVRATAIRLRKAPSDEPGGAEIEFLAVDDPNPWDVDTSTTGFRVFVEPWLAEELDDAVLDAEPTPDGPAFAVHRRGDG